MAGQLKEFTWRVQPGVGDPESYCRPFESAIPVRPRLRRLSSNPSVSIPACERALPTPLVVAAGDCSEYYGLQDFNSGIVLKNLVTGLSQQWISFSVMRWRVPSKSSISEALQRGGASGDESFISSSGFVPCADSRDVGPFLGGFASDGGGWACVFDLPYSPGGMPECFGSIRGVVGAPERRCPKSASGGFLVGGRAPICSAISLISPYRRHERVQVRRVVALADSRHCY